MKKLTLMAFFRGYGFSLILFSAIILGGFVGIYEPHWGPILKPFGDIFLHLMFTVVVPLVFFSVASSIASVTEFRQLGRILLSMILVFLFMGVIAAGYMSIVSQLFPLTKGFVFQSTSTNLPAVLPEHNLLGLLTVSDFAQLFTREHMLALILFAFLLGCSVLAAGEKGKPFQAFLQSGMAVFMKLTDYIMYYAPMGFFAYFAVLIGQWGHDFLGAYYHVGIIYYLAALIYFVVFFTGYVLLTKKKGRVFWKNIIPTSITALATCSSAASLPVNLESTEKMGVAPEIYQTVIPLGTIIHKQGSIMGGVVKIVFLLTLFHVPLIGYSAWITMILTALLVGTVMGAIPSGGMLGEMLIISMYGFPPEALMLIAVISLIIDPLATLLNVVGNSVASLLTEKIFCSKVLTR